MGYATMWKILEEIITEFRKKQLTIPETVMNDLKAAKTMINIVASADSDHGEANLKIEGYLGNVEAYLVTEAQKHFTHEQIDTWLRRLEQANCCTCEESTEEQRFVAGVPRDQKWVRVEPLPDLPTEELKRLAQETKLSTSTQKDGRMIVYGQAENLKEFLKKMTGKAGKKRQQQS